MSSIALVPPYACMTAPTTGVSMEISKPTGVMLNAIKTAETAIIVPQRLRRLPSGCHSAGLSAACQKNPSWRTNHRFHPSRL